MDQSGADFLATDSHHILVAGIGLLHVRPHRQKLAGVRRQLAVLPGDQFVEVAGVLLALLEEGLGGFQRLALARDERLLGGVPVVAAQGVGDLGQIAHAVGRHDGAPGRGMLDADRRQAILAERQPALGQARRQRLIQRGDAVVVEARRHGAEHRHVFGFLGEAFAIALVLLAYVAQRVFRALAVELVDRDEIGEVQHVDLFQLRGGAELGRHHIQRDIDQRHDGRVALADARGFDHDQVETGDLAGGDDIGQRLGDLAAGVARRQRAHVDMGMLDRVHADAIAEQRAAGALARGIDGDHRDALRVVLVEAEAADQFVGQRALAGAAGTGDAQSRLGRYGGGLFQQGLFRLLRPGAVLQGGDDLRQVAQFLAVVLDLQRLDVLRCALADIHIATRHHVVDHALQAHALAVLHRIQMRHAILVQFLHFGRHDHAAAAAEHLDALAATLFQQIDHVLEKLDVSALVRGYRNALGVFLQRRIDDLFHRTVVPKMNHFDAGRLQDAPHDID